MKKIIILFVVCYTSIITYAQVGIGTTSPDQSAVLDIDVSNLGPSDKRGFLPPRMTEVERDDIAMPAAGLMVYNTSTNKPNYFNGTEWLNFDGTTANSIPEVGENFEGGTIFYIFQSGDEGFVVGEIHGLIAAPSDQSTGIVFFQDSTDPGINASSSDVYSIGKGDENTAAIVSALGTATDYAARICDELVFNGYEDWFLPSRSELFILYSKKDDVGGFEDSSYWTSSPLFNNTWSLDFTDGGGANSNRQQLFNVRAVRQF